MYDQLSFHNQTPTHRMWQGSNQDHDPKMQNYYSISVPKLSIMIIYNSTWSFLIQWIWFNMIVRWQSDLLKSKESVIPVCSKPYPMSKRKVQKGVEIKVLQNFAFGSGPACCVKSVLQTKIYKTRAWCKTIETTLFYIKRLHQPLEMVFIRSKTIAYGHWNYQSSLKQTNLPGTRSWP